MTTTDEDLFGCPACARELTVCAAMAGGQLRMRRWLRAQVERQREAHAQVCADRERRAQRLLTLTQSNRAAQGVTDGLVR